MKNKFGFLLFSIFCLCLLGACRKEKQVLDNPCEDAYDQRSRSYTNLYSGSLPVCPVSLKYIIPDKYSNFEPILNATNDNELFFLRKDNKSKIFAICKFDFCTNKTNVVRDGLDVGYDLSKDNWLLFVENDGLWKMKPNGDSLIRIGPRYYSYFAWSPSGSRCFNGNKIFDKDGNVLYEYDLPKTWGYIFETDTTFLCNESFGQKKGSRIFRYNLNSKTTQDLFLEPTDKIGLPLRYKPIDDYIYLYTKHDFSNDFSKFNIKTWQKTVLKNFPDSQTGNYYIYGVLKDRYLGTAALKDTLTGGIPCAINYREHIIFMNLNDNNIRQVIIPE